MKYQKFSFLLLLLLLLSSLSCTPKITLLLSEPSISNLRFLGYLMDHHKIPAMKVVGIYHEQERDRFQNSMEYAIKRKLSWIKFQAITGNVPQNKLFGQNKWTNQFHALFVRSQGIIFPGGPDIPPSLYGHKTNLLTAIRTPKRHFYELSLLFHLLGGFQNSSFIPFLAKKRQYLVLGICLGMQSLNVATGGTLYQDIPSELYHCQTYEQTAALPAAKQHKNYSYALTRKKGWTIGNFHPIIFKPTKFFHNDALLKNSPFVFSIHHQCAQKLGKNIVVWATSQDGKVVEGICHRLFHHVLGVQFHPERYEIWTNNTLKLLNSQKKIADVFYGHKPTLRFHNQFWKMISKYLQESQKSDRKD